MKLKVYDIYMTLKNIFLVVLGTLILAFGISIFILPFDMVVGGVSGYAVILDRVLPLEFVSVELIVMVLSWILFFFGLIVLGKDFALKTLVSTISYPLFISLFLRLRESGVLSGFFDIGSYGYSEISLIISSVFGGLLIGAGCAISFIGGGSTGGMDIIAFSICKFFKRAKSPVVIFALDLTAILLGLFVIRNLIVSLLGVVSVFISALVIDKLFLGGKRALVAQIITDRYEDINIAVIERLERTTTILNATGGYSGKEKKVIMVNFTMNQYRTLMNIVNYIDSNAFITVYQAYEINGEGWKN